MDARTRVRMAAVGVALSLALAQAGPLVGVAFAETVATSSDGVAAAVDATASLEASPTKMAVAVDTTPAVDAVPGDTTTQTPGVVSPEAPVPFTRGPAQAPTKGAITPMIASGQYGYLWTPWHLQERSYWCGPATCQIVTHYFGRLVSQSTFASFMGTTTNGTAFYRVADALRNYSGRPYYYYGGLGAGTVTTKVSDSISGHAMPLVADVNVVPGIWNQYRFSHSGHILPVEGYDWRYGNIRVCDPYNEATYRMGGGSTGGHVTHTLNALLNGVGTHPQRAVVAAP